MNTFRLSNKKIYNDSRSTIENLHNEKIDEILIKNDTLDSKQKKIEYLREKLKLLSNNKDTTKNYKQITCIADIRNEIKKLELEIDNIINNHDLIDYIDKAWEFIVNFDEPDACTGNCTGNGNGTGTGLSTDVSTGLSTNVSTDVSTDVSTEVPNKEQGILNFVNKTGKFNKGEEYTRYYNKCFLNILAPAYSINCCKNCKKDRFEVDYKNGIIICNNCGLCENYIECNSSAVNYRDATHMETISQPFSYQRKNHFKEWLNQLQGKEVTAIPDSVINLILIELKKERITDTKEITSERIKKYLKKLKLNKYYEHIPNLISKITKKPPLIISYEFEDILLKLFDKIQEPFKKYCPKERKNFLSYSYTLHKFCQLLGKDEYLIYFPLLKSREKLFEQEKIWKGISIDLNWKFTPCI